MDKEPYGRPALRIWLSLREQQARRGDPVLPVPPGDQKALSREGYRSEREECKMAPGIRPLFRAELRDMNPYGEK